MFTDMWQREQKLLCGYKTHKWQSHYIASTRPKTFLSLFRHCRCDNHVEMIILPRMSFCLLIKSITWHNISVIIIIVDSASSRYTAERGRLKNNVQTFQSVKFIQSDFLLSKLTSSIDKCAIQGKMKNWWHHGELKMKKERLQIDEDEWDGTYTAEHRSRHGCVKSCCSKEKLMTCHDDEGWKSSEVGGKIS